MVFSSVSFLCYFFPLFLISYIVLPKKNLVLFIFSLTFYAWGEGYYVFLLLVSITANYFIGRFMASNNNSIRYRAFAFGIVFNLVTICYYKYFKFITHDVFGLDLAEHMIPHLPLGISFFTFQAMSYLFDTYRRKAPPADSWLDLATYISMFPQLVAGPVVRYDTIIDRLKKRYIRSAHIYRGILLFSIGLSQKVLVADIMGKVSDQIFALGNEQISPLLAWTGAISYTLQIYFDFGGYSNMAIGIGLLLGFKFPLNFNYPYISRSITEFWRRWHISLSTWFRDYLYISIGGNRRGNTRTLLNLMVVFLLCGLWHGAEWTFLVWGGYHGLFLIIERFGLKKILNSLPYGLSLIYTLFVVMIGWIIFRSESFGQAYFFIKAFIGLGAVTDKAPSIWEFVNMHCIVIAFIGVIASTPLIKELSGRIKLIPMHQLQHVNIISSVFWGGILISLGLLGVSFMYLVSSTYHPFIYFRF